MIKTGPHNFASKQFSKNESLHQTTKEIKLTAVKNTFTDYKDTFQNQCTIFKKLPLATPQC